MESPGLHAPGSRRLGVGAAVNGQVRAGDVGGLRPGDEGDERGDLVNMPVTLERGVGDLRRGPIARGGIQIGIDGARLDIVDRDAACCRLRAPDPA